MRQPWIAVVLSLLCPGLGHLYAGHFGRGLVFLLLPFVVIFGFVWLSVAPSSVALLGVLVGVIFVLPFLYLFAILDAWRLAKRAPADYVPKWWQKPLVYALVIVLSVISAPLSALFLRAEVVEAFKIPGSSMAQTILPGDRVLVTKWRWTGADAKKGEIVVFRVQVDGRRVHYIKRVAGLSGDVVDGPDGEKLTVPAGQVWMLGDNAANSRDSRQLGPVPLVDLLGPAPYRYWPPTRFGTIE